MKKNGYVGEIANSGQQVVKAPLLKKNAKSGTVKKGTDLRSK